MTIGYDAKRAVANLTGLGNYSRLVVDVLSRDYRQDRFVLLSSVCRENPRLEPLLNRPNVVIDYPRGLWRAMPSMWRSSSGIINAARRQKTDLFHGLAGELPLGIEHSGIPSVVTIHDLIFNRFPQGYNYPDRKIYDAKARHACRVATRIIAISEKTRDDIVEYYHVDPAKIDVVYQGCEPAFGKPHDKALIESLAARFNLGSTYFIAVGTIEERKNQLLAVKAIGQMPENVRLALVGRFRGRYGAAVERYISEHNLGDRVRHLSGLTLDQLAALTAGATGAIYVSRYEGFGLPVIEAIAAGTPVIAATGSCLEEAGGPGALYIHPDSLDSLVANMKRLLADSALCRQMVADGRRYTARFDASRFAAAVMDVYQKAL